MMEYHDKSTEYIAKIVAQELETDFKQTYEMIKNFAHSDESGSFAIRVKYHISMHDGNNHTISTKEVYLED